MTDDTPTREQPRESSFAARLLLSLALGITLVFFFLDGFVLESMDSSAVLLGVLAVLLVVGLVTLSASAIPRGISLRTTSVVLAGTIITGVLSVNSGVSALFVAICVGAAGGLLSLITQHVTPADTEAIYIGAFAGMTSPLVLLGPAHLVAAGLVTGVIWSIVRDAWTGIGGKMGTVAFAGVGLTTVVAVSLGGVISMPTIPLYSPPGVAAILIVSVTAAGLTHWLAYRRGWGLILASAVPSAAAFIVFFGVSGAAQLPHDALAAAWVGASFVGMTSPDRLLHRWWTLPLMALAFAFLVIHFQAHLAGLGGDLGATAAAAVIIVTGLESVVQRISALRTSVG